jgi:hypothetical protein
MTRHHLTIAAELAALGLLTAIALGFGINQAGMASGYVDPLLHAGAQDEAVYGHAAARMARTGHVLTPVFLDRYMLNKPPLLMWAGAASMRWWGINSQALRLPVLGAGVLCCLLVYGWVRRSQSLPAAILGVVLLLGMPLFHAMNRRFMTDALLTLFVVAAMWVVAMDPHWESWATAIAFGAFSGAAVMTKSAAGLLPLLILTVYWVLAGATERPPLKAICVAFAVAALVAVPWHAYQFIAHKDWFIAEYVRFQLLGSGVTAPSRYTEDSNLWFYVRTLWRTDPILLVVWLTSLPWIGMEWRRSNQAPARLLTAWFVTSAVCLGIFGTRAAYYLLPLLPVLALMSVQFSPLLRGRLAWPACLALLVLFGAKVWAGNAIWGLDYHANAVPPAPVLDQYSRLRRANDLVVVSPDDEFYASVADLWNVRYVYLTRLDATKTSEFFYRLGMILSSEDFCSLDRLLPVYEQRLRAWNLPELFQPEGTIISAQSTQDLAALIRCSPNRDFMLPEELRAVTAGPAAATHMATGTESGRFFLLSQDSHHRAAGAIAPGAVPDSH